MEPGKPRGRSAAFMREIGSVGGTRSGTVRRAQAQIRHVAQERVWVGIWLPAEIVGHLRADSRRLGRPLCQLMGQLLVDEYSARFGVRTKKPFPKPW